MSSFKILLESIILSILCVSCSQAFTSEPVEKPNPHHKNITLDVYYESKCPDCIDFFKKQLCPTYYHLGRYFEIHLYPYGNAEIVNSTVTCQHGPKECVGNRQHACSLEHVGFTTSIHFICCAMSTKDPVRSAKSCAKKSNIDFKRLGICFNGEEGKKLERMYGSLTNKLKPHHKFVPWIIINKKFNKKEMNLAMNDLSSVICDHIHFNKPIQCNSIV